MSVKVEVSNTDNVLNSLKKHFESGLMPALLKAKEIVEDKFTNNPTGWVPLAQATLLQRRYLGFGSGPMLYRTGHLKSVAVEEVAIDSPNEGHISTSDPMAIVQNNGGGNIPARPFYSLSDADRKAIYEAFKAGIK
jgi:phage gpG-like protein